MVQSLPYSSFKTPCCPPGNGDRFLAVMLDRMTHWPPGCLRSRYHVWPDLTNPLWSIWDLKISTSTLYKLNTIDLGPMIPTSVPMVKKREGWGWETHVPSSSVSSVSFYILNSPNVTPQKTKCFLSGQINLQYYHGFWPLNGIFFLPHLLFSL